MQVLLFYFLIFRQSSTCVIIDVITGRLFLLLKSCLHNVLSSHLAANLCQEQVIQICSGMSKFVGAATVQVKGNHIPQTRTYRTCQVSKTQSPCWQWHRTGSSWSSVLTLLVAPLWCDLVFFPNSRGNKAAANLRPKYQRANSTVTQFFSTSPPTKAEVQ